MRKLRLGEVVTCGLAAARTAGGCLLMSTSTSPDSSSLICSAPPHHLLGQVPADHSTRLPTGGKESPNPLVNSIIHLFI